MDFFYTLTPNLRTFLGILVDLGSRSTLDKLGCLKCKRLEAEIEYFNISFLLFTTVNSYDYKNGICAWLQKNDLALIHFSLERNYQKGRSVSSELQSNHDTRRSNNITYQLMAQMNPSCGFSGAFKVMMWIRLFLLKT